MLINKEGDKFYLKQCDRCNYFFFITAKNGRICEDCLSPKYKKFFSERKIKYVSYSERYKLKKSRRIKKWNNKQ